MSRCVLAACWTISFVASGGHVLSAQSTPQPPAGAFHPPAAGAPVATAPGAGPAAPSPVAEPVPVPAFENWRFNARERTARGLAAWNGQKPAEAAAALDTAARLRPDDPLAAYNAGTAHLGAGLADAVPLLERALESAPPELAADAQFNLGNARFAAQDAQGAVDSFKETLRRAPGHAGARRNLELAQRLLEQQQQQQQQQDQNQNQDRNENGQQQQNPGSDGEQNPDQPPGEQPPPDGSQPDGDRQPDGSEGQQQPGQGGGSQRESPLPQFKDQKDMSAEQAASILQAVDNLEREKRREEAKRRALVKSGVEKDW